MINKKKRHPPPSKFASIYYNPKHPAGFTGSAKVLASAVNSSVKDARHWLAGEDPYTLYKQARKRFKHEQIYVEGLDSQFAADLIDVQSLTDANDGIKYILTVVDTLSKYAWAVGLRDKTANTVAKALKVIFKERKPRRLRTDRGREFLGAAVQNLLKENDITFFTADNYTKEAIVERSIAL